MAQPGTRQDFAGTTRFQLRRKIGEGGMGVVWEAVDKERLTNVALKTLRTLAPDALLRFKHEFRALQDVSHPNLVSLGELVEEGGQWFFTMELVRGVPLLKWVRPNDDFATAEVTTTGPTPRRAASPAPTPLGTFDEVRMRAAFAQLADAVAALHARGLVHRDIKPSNVLVTEAGRVVLLDFGVVAEAAAHGDGVIVGTAAYMAPEQASGARVTGAADWYAFGAVLHQALTGRIPNAPDASPRALAPELPLDLDALCRALTAADPAARPTDAEVLALLGVRAPSAVPHAAGFVGRAGELAALHEAFAAARAQTSALVVYGESGVGKSALVRRFIDELHERAPEALVLAGRCYERESVHYKAVDGAIDALARWLSSLWPDELERLLPRELALAAELFPVLLRVDAIADLERAPALAEAPEDPHELRNRAFAALRALFAAIAATRPLVLALDDLQWADADSLALIAELVRAPDAPRLLLLLTMRATDEAAPRELALRLGGDARLVAVPPLAFAEARQLAAELLGRADGEGPLSAAVIAAEARGHPLFIDELVRHKLLHAEDALAPPPMQLDDALAARVARLDADERRVLEIVCVAGAPITQAIAAAAAACDFDAFARIATTLRAQNLVRGSGVHPGDTVEPYHDRVREALLRRLDAPARKMRHGRLALALEATRQADAQALALHFAEAGDREKAAKYVGVAAEEAARALAFDRAVTLYREALAMAPAGGKARRELAIKVGESLANAGRGAEAARAYEDASDLHEERADSGDLDAAAIALELRRRAAEQWLRGGHVDEGLSAVRSVLGAVGMRMPSTPTGALASLLWGRARVRLRGLRFRERPAGDVPPKLLQRLDTSLSVAVGMGLVDTIRGADFQTRSLLLALRAGEPSRVARALAMEAAHSSAAGGPSAARSARLIAAAAAVAAKADAPELSALVAATSGIVAFLEGRWRYAHERCSEGERIFRDRCVGTAWEADSAQAFKLWALSYLGEMRELSRAVPQAIHEAEERGDLYAATNLRIGELNFVHLVADDVPGARRAAATAMAAWSRQGFHHQHWDNLLAEGTTDLYAGDAAGAWKRVRETWKPLKRSLLLMIQLTRIEAVHLYGRAALAAGEVGEAARAAKKLAREKMAWADPLAALLAAGVARTAGDLSRTRALTEEAARGFDAVDMALWAAVARRQLGLVVGGDEGAALVAAADALLRAQSVRDPARVAATLAPGFA